MDLDLASLIPGLAQPQAQDSSVNIPMFGGGTDPSQQSQQPDTPKKPNMFQRMLQGAATNVQNTIQSQGGTAISYPWQKKAAKAPSGGVAVTAPDAGGAAQGTSQTAPLQRGLQWLLKKMSQQKDPSQSPTPTTTTPDYGSSDDGQ